MCEQNAQLGIKILKDSNTFSKKNEYVQKPCEEFTSHNLLFIQPTFLNWPF